MGKVHTPDIGEFYHQYPSLATVVTVQAEGVANAMAVAWHSVVSHMPPLYGVSVSPKRFTHDLILRAGEFAVNFLPFEEARLIAATGGVSGREVDKFKSFKVARVESQRTGAPILERAYAAYECKLVAHYECGDHTWFVGEIVMVHFLEEAFTEKGTLDLTRVNPALYLGADLYVTTNPGSLIHLDRKACIAEFEDQ